MSSGEIVVVSRSMPWHEIGGMEIVAWDLSRELARLGCRVRILTTAIPGRPREFVSDDVRVVALAGVDPGRYSGAWWRQSRRYFESHCIGSTDAVLSVSAGAFGLLSLQSGAAAGIPFVMQVHGTSFGEAVSKWRSGDLVPILRSAYNLLMLPRDMWAYRRFAALVAVGERVRDDLIRLPLALAVDRSKVHLIENGIDTALFRPCRAARARVCARLDIDSADPIVLSASRLHRQKGLDNVLFAFRELLRTTPAANLLIAGDGPARPALQQLTAELNIDRRVRFLGLLNRAATAEAMQAADAFWFLTQRVEGLPLNVLEALASGLPCFVSRHLQSIPGSSIRYVDPRAAAEVAKLTSNALDGSSARHACLLPSRFSLNSRARAYAELLHSVRA